MPKSAFADVIRYLHRVCALHGDSALSDRELLGRFVESRYEDAFTVLVRRHGPMIFGVCRRLLGDSPEAEDALQATFLVLVRRAQSIRRRESLGSWLHSVAQRVALRARAQSATRRRREREAGNMATSRPIDDSTWQELRLALDEEIGALSEKYRAPIILCFLEGKTHAQAARALGCPTTSLTRRLAKGRDLLRARLERRGITLAAGALATALADAAAAAPLPAMLTMKTVQAATLAAAGKLVAGGCLTARAVVLAEEALRGMVVGSKLVGLVLAVGVVVGGIGWAEYRTSAETARMDQAAVSRDGQRSADSVPRRAVAVDQYGDALPEGAVARLGSKRFRHEGVAGVLAFSADGKTLAGCTGSGVILWDAATGKERHRLSAPVPRAGYAIGIGFSADGRTLAISDEVFANDETKVAIWNLHTGKKTRVLTLPKGKGPAGQQQRFDQIVFAPDGHNLILARSNDPAVAIIELSTGQVRKSLRGEDSQAFYRLAVSPDSKTLATIAFTDDRNALNSVHAVQLWELATGRLIRTLYNLPPLSTDPQKRVQSHESYVTAIAFSPDGKKLAFGNMSGIDLTDPATGKDLGQLKYRNGSGPIGLAFTPDGKNLVSSWLNDGVVVWNVATRAIVRTLKSRVTESGCLLYNNRVYILAAMALSPNGKTVASTNGGRTVQLWDIGSGEELSTAYQGHDSSITDLAFSPGGETLVSAGSLDRGQILLWDAKTWTQKGYLPGNGHCLSFSLDAMHVISVKNETIKNDTKVRVLEVGSGKEALVINVPEFASPAEPAQQATEVIAAALSRGGDKLFTLNWRAKGWARDVDKSFVVRHWDFATGKQESLWTVPPQQTWTPCLAQDGKTVFAELHAGGIGIYDAESGRKRILRGDGKWQQYEPFVRSESGQGMRLSLSPDGRILAFGAPQSAVRLWEIVTGKELFTLEGHQGTVSCVAWSPDARLIATGEKRREMHQPSIAQTVRIWDAATGKEWMKFGGFNADVSALTFSRDGTSVLAGLEDGTILVFDIKKSAANLVRTPESAKELELRWTELMGDNATQANRAIWTLVAAPKMTVPCLRDRLKPIVIADDAKIQRWLVDLNSDKFTIRQAATKGLEKAGSQIQAPIQTAMKGNITLESRRRLEQILNTLLDIPGPETIRTVRAIMVLERIGSPEAKTVLESLARGAPGARETEEAKASLERLNGRTTALR